MPPLALYPTQPLGMPDIRPGYGDDASPIYAGQYRPAVSGSSGQQLLPYEEAVLKAYRDSSGYQRDKMAQDAKTAKDDLDYKYAAMKQTAKTASEQAALDRWYKGEQLKLATRSADLQDKQYGLDYAKAETQYLSSPDTMFQARQLTRSANAIAGGGNAYGAYRAGGDMEQPNTAEDFGRLAQGPGGPGSPRLPSAGAGGGGGTAGSITNLYAPGGGSSTMAATSMAQQAGGAGDTRLKALKAIGDALPPSAGQGLTARDGSALTAFHAVYSAPGGDDMDQADAAGSALLAKNPGEYGLGQYESFLPGTRAALGSLMKAKGIYQPDYEAAWQRSRPGQGSSLAA